ncbi:hypothetical protein [Alphaproteobacteria bacterium endosymbiont of Tiliacea citrago]|uniref:hypothetical protein n=1 Tax=Alphaproteobacteria bacterium endosymbiont of Tiliacea citrago TaxID=3077944 RepID=UPI00313CA037
MKKKSLFIFGLFFVFFIHSNKVESQKINESTKGSLSKMEQFKKEFLQSFPCFDFNEDDVFSIISYFRVTLRKNEFKKAFDILDSLQLKYSDDLEITRLIFFYKYVLCCVFFDIEKYSQVNQQYMRIASVNFKHEKNIQKISFLVRNKYYSNESEYSISVKFSDNYFLKKMQVNDSYLDSVFELMKVSKECLALKVLNESLSSPYGESWIESVWYCVECINKKDFDNLDVFYYVLIEFLFNQGLEEKSFVLYSTMKEKFSNSEFTKLAGEFFEKKI